MTKGTRGIINANPVMWLDFDGLTEWPPLQVLTRKAGLLRRDAPALISWYVTPGRTAYSGHALIARRASSWEMLKEAAAFAGADLAHIDIAQRRGYATLRVDPRPWEGMRRLRWIPGTVTPHADDLAGILYYAAAWRAWPECAAIQLFARRQYAPGVFEAACRRVTVVRYAGSGALVDHGVEMARAEVVAHDHA